MVSVAIKLLARFQVLNQNFCFPMQYSHVEILVGSSDSNSHLHIQNGTCSTTWMY